VYLNPILSKVGISTKKDCCKQ